MIHRINSIAKNRMLSENRLRSFAFAQKDNPKYGIFFESGFLFVPTFGVDELVKDFKVLEQKEISNQVSST